MKKSLLILTLFFSTSIFWAQNFNQPSQFNNVCDDNNDGIASFSLNEISFEILANFDPQSYLITHHETQTEAQTGTNALSSPYVILSPFAQTVWARIVKIASGQVTILFYNLSVNPIPIVQNISYTLCDNDSNPNDGMTGVDLTQQTPAVLAQQTGAANNYIVTYYTNQSDAELGISFIITATNYVTSTTTIWVRVENITTQCHNTGYIELILQDCGGSSCSPSTNLVTTDITETSATLTWTNPDSITESLIYIAPAGSSAPTIASNAYYAQGSSYTFEGLTCGTQYDIYIRTYCTSVNMSTWVQTTFSTVACVPQAGEPVDLRQCVNDNGLACFDLFSNTTIIINTLNPVDYSITYYNSESNALNNDNPLTSPYCTSTSQAVFARLENNITQAYQILGFSLIVDTVSSVVTPLNNMQQCDDNNDGVVTFDLTTVQAQINTNNTLEYYPSLSNAQNQVVPFTNPQTLNIGIQNPITNVFVREIVPNSCDSIYSFQLNTYSNCNLASVCSQANSLCNSIGVPFSNTVNNSSTGSANCLLSSPNPTWFYLPISNPGTINLQINQNSLNGTPLDVDYIVYGPFTNPVSPCGNPNLLLANVVSCSFSVAAVEFPLIPNAQPGQYYLLMVTNYSNQAGFITITELGNSSGGIDCSGLRLNAFLDSNNNGTQDNGEQNFPLGQFSYEVNNNGNVHNIISPTGIYNIYDTSNSNSYNFSYTIDSDYVASYGITTSNYSNIYVVIGAGMQTYNFPITVTQSYNDLAVNIVPINAPRPGFTYQNKIVYTNFGNQTVVDGTVTFTKDALVTITDNSQTGTTSSPNGFTYNFTNLLPFETRTIILTMQVPNVPTVVLGDLLTNTASIAPISGDVVPTNNTSNCSQIIIGSYDPNDKMESHGERILHSTFTANDYLYYTIRFENTGTASAINVRVNDVLDSRLDENTIRMISASHNYIMDRVDNNLTWRFDDIQLPVSVANTTTGKGYITFQVKPRVGFAVGDIIPNTASIYFDFNPAIITNTFNTEFVAQLGVDEFENGDFVFYPNPVSDIVTVSVKNNGTIAAIAVYDMLGKVILSEKTTTTDSSKTFDLSSVSKGVYLLEVTSDTNLKVIKKLIVE